MYGLARRNILPKSIASGFDALPSFSKWAEAVIEQESVTFIYDEEAIIAGTLKRIENQKAQAKAASK